MDAPKCRACGKKEWGHVCGDLPPEVLAEKKPRAKKAAVAEKRVEPCSEEKPEEAVAPGEGGPIPQVERNKAWRKAHPEKYRKYMAKYMVEYRAYMRKKRGGK